MTENVTFRGLLIRRLEAFAKKYPKKPEEKVEMAEGKAEEPAVEAEVPAIEAIISLREEPAGSKLINLLQPDNNLSDIEQQRLQRLVDIRRELTVYEKLESLPDSQKARVETVHTKVDEAIDALDPYFIHQSYPTLDIDWVEQVVLNVASAQNFVTARLYQIEGQINGKDLSDFEAFLTSYNVADSHW